MTDGEVQQVWKISAIARTIALEERVMHGQSSIVLAGLDC